MVLIYAIQYLYICVFNLVLFLPILIIESFLKNLNIHTAILIKRLICQKNKAQILSIISYALIIHEFQET